MSTLGTLGVWVVPFLFGLTIVVFFHELGHFLVARWCGVRVLVFSIGFGPELFGFNDRYGTRWKVSAVPLGGYVKFFGDDSAASTPDQSALQSMNETERRLSFFHQPVSRRAAIVAAGPLANFILAIVIFAGVLMTLGRPVMTPRVDAVQPGSAAAEAGLQPGDLVLAIDGRRVADFVDMQRIVSGSAGRTLTITVNRGGAPVDLKATPRQGKGGFCNGGLLGISRSNAGETLSNQTVGPIAALGMGVDETHLIIDRTLCYIGNVFIGRESADQLGGPGRIAQVLGEGWKGTFDHAGFFAALGDLLQKTAFLSVSIGLLNLFPIPLLDGGHLLFYLIEAVRGRPLSERAQEMGFRFGLVVVVMLMIFATFNDILHWTRT
ncbi:MAG: RIP metalloprotease [Pseudorhodoplanes sp.]